MIDLNKDNYSKEEVESFLEKQRGITSKAMEAKYEKKLANVTELQSQVDTLSTQNVDLTTQLNEKQTKIFDLETKPKLMEEFTKAGGNKDSFEDFMTLHGKDLTADGVDLSAKLGEIKETKGHFFTGEPQKQEPSIEDIERAKKLGEPVNVQSTGTEKATPEDFIGKSNPYRKN